MTRATYTEIVCKSALNRVTGMPFRWSLNPYRGCVHACAYCYARATHAWFGLNAGDDFERRILVKANVVEVLRREVRRRGWAGESIAIGTATDPYQPCEGRFRLTRGILETLLEQGNPLSIVTKSTLVLRDLDLLARLATETDVAVYFTVTTLDERLWRVLEPGTPPPAKRLAVLRRLRDAGVPAGVFMAPILPGLTDSAASIAAVAAAAREHGALSFSAPPLRLDPLVKEHYFGVVAAKFPELLPRYERAYAGANPPPVYAAALARRVAAVRRQFGFADGAMPPRGGAGSVSAIAPAARGGQLALPI
ncbi:MAG TPA: radical SAM protein [Thermomicrobiales bacterium]|jgi:DNA repair photolyase|nr:radical SAM protein [Thermomicrobiales bacterium]